MNGVILIVIVFKICFNVVFLLFLKIRVLNVLLIVKYLYNVNYNNYVLLYFGIEFI